MKVEEVLEAECSEMSWPGCFYTEEWGRVREAVACVRVLCWSRFLLHRVGSRFKKTTQGGRRLAPPARVAVVADRPAVPGCLVSFLFGSSSGASNSKQQQPTPSHRRISDAVS